MKITFILPHAALSGGTRVAAIYAERLQKRGHEVTIVSIPKPSLTLKGKVKALLKDKKIPLRKKSPSHLDDITVEHKILEKYRPITNNDVPEADVVIATWWETAEWVITFNKSKGIKFYFVQGHEIFHDQTVERIKSTYRLPLKKITISNWLLDIMDKEYGDKEVSLVPNGVDYEFFNAPRRGKQLTLTVGFIYHASPIKGCDIIIEALKSVQKNIPKMKIIAFGINRPSSELPLPASTRFCYQPKQVIIREIYSSCDIWIFGSRSEGFGLPILEAMACRTPVIATPAGAAPEILKNGGGILLSNYTVESMAKAILGINDMAESDWQMISEQAHEAVRKYSWDDATVLFEKSLLKYLNFESK